MAITLPNSQADQSFRSIAGKRSNGRAVYLVDLRLALLGRSPVGVEKSVLMTPCPVAAGSVFSGKVQVVVKRGIDPKICPVQTEVCVRGVDAHIETEVRD